MKTPLKDGILQSDLDCAGFDLLNFDGVSGSGLPPGGIFGQLLQKQSSTDGDADWATVSTGGGGSNPLITVNVKDAPYSAIGNGVTDDSAAINSAIAAVSSAGGGTVFFPRGTYLCNGAFDGSYNSILTIPRTPPPSNVYKAICFLGETAPDGPCCPIIKSTKTGTGTVPAILAAGPYVGGSPGVSDFNYVSVYINNLEFRVDDNPSITAIRLDVASKAGLRDVWVQAGTYTVQPTHGTVGVWMPALGNSVQTTCDRVFVAGFDTAFRVSEHFRATDIFTVRNNVGIEFLDTNNGPSWVNLTTYQNVSDVKFSGNHGVQLLLDCERGQTLGNWYDPGTTILDPSNFGRGEIKYEICVSNVGRVSGPISISGGNYLSLTDYQAATTTFAPSGLVTVPLLYVGTDARFTAISGGVKLEVRNAGTGVWVEATRYTNP